MIESRTSCDVVVEQKSFFTIALVLCFNSTSRSAGVLLDFANAFFHATRLWASLLIPSKRFFRSAAVCDDMRLLYSAVVVYVISEEA